MLASPFRRPLSSSCTWSAAVVSGVMILASVCHAVHGEDRLTVAVPTNEEELVSDLLERVAAAVNAEDFKSYSQCFSKAAREKHCKEAARLFVGHDLEMEVGRWSITTASAKAISFTLQYTFYRDGIASTRVSEIDSVVSGGTLQIAAENQQSVRHITRTEEVQADVPPPLPPAPIAMDRCQGGHCPLAHMPSFPKPDTPLSLFNDSSGKPSVNGPMWVDPFEIVKRFPEKSGRCGVLRAHGIDCETGKPILSR
jgi:hypothetical protein